MKFNSYKTTTLALFASLLIMSGCGGGSSNPPVPDTTAPIFTQAEITYDVMEGLALEIDASATDDRGGVVRYSEDQAEFTINNIGILSFTAQTVNSDVTFSVAVTATDEANNSAEKNIIVRVKDRGIENRTVMPQKSGRVFRDRGDGTVVNTHTGFLWQKSVFVGKNYNEAKSSCDSLNLVGITNWRLPTRMDLNKLINYTDFPVGFDKELNSTIDGAAHGEYWTDEEKNITHSWSISFNASGGDNENLKTKKIFSRCVSGIGNKASFGGSHTDAERVDNDTDLFWKVTKEVGDFNSTKTHCTSPYRLPTFNELLSIVEFEPITVLGDSGEYDMEGNPISYASQDNGFGTFIWTSTGYEENDVNKTKVLYITPAEISDGGIEKNATAGIVCVK